MYLKDKSVDMHLRLSPQQFAFVSARASAYRMSVQDYVRLLVVQSMAVQKSYEEKRFSEK